MPIARTRDSGRLRLTVSSARTVRLPTVPDGPPLLPWPVAAIGGGVAAAVAGALVVAGVVLVAWLSAIAISLSAVLGFSAQVWLLAHGGTVVLGADRVTLVPLGLTLLCCAICAWLAGIAYSQGRQARTGDLTPAIRLRLLAGTVAQVTLGYTLTVLATAWLAAGPDEVWRPGLGALALSAVGATIGAGAAAGLRPRGIRPDWLRHGLRGGAVGVLGCVAIAAVVLATAMVLGETRVATLESALGFDSGGAFVWSLVTLAYLPNLLGWALAWALGAGFTVGSGSLVTLWTTELGMLPAIPVLGGLPPAGVSDPWLLAWLAGGALAGALAGVAAARHGRTSAVGALLGGAVGGLAAALAFLGWAAASRGGLGSLRLVDLGPRLTEAALIGGPLLLLGSVLAALVTWLVRRRGRAA